MKRWLGVALVLAVGFLATVRSQQPPTPPGPEYVPGELLVQYASNAPLTRRDAMLSNQRARLVRRLDQLDIDHVQLAAGQSVADAIAAFRAQPGVLAVQANYVRHAVQAQSPPPNDPKWLDGSLYGLVKIQAQNVWNTLNAHGDGTVVVADIDTGINYNHQDLAANVWTNPNEIAGDHIDNDGNGFVDDIHGIDTVNVDSDPMDDNGHGTHTAGTIAAVGNNSIGVVGVNWNAKVLSCKFLNSSGSGSDQGAANCLNYIVDLKLNHHINIRVTSNSWGGYGGDPTVLRNAFVAAGNAGIISFAAAGNDGLDLDAQGGVNLFYPASLALDNNSPVVAVASSDQNDNKSGFSNYGHNTVALAAPGSGILSTYFPGNATYGTLSGTSMATPHVSGTAALLSSIDPSLNVQQLKAVITGNVDVLASFGGLVSTGGRLNAFKAACAIAQCGGGGSATAAFVTTDSTTQGNWQGVYGGDGYSLEGDATSLPSYATLTPTGASTYTWASSTADTRALQRPGGGRIAATWYNDPSFQLDVNVGPSQHQVALYSVDWDTTSRSQQIDVLDAGTSAVLDTRTISGFNGGKYLVWTISGHVRFKVTKLGGANAVVSAVFFGPAGAANHPPTASLTGPPDGSIFNAPASVMLTATATDPDSGDTIDHVTFLANGSAIGSSSTPVGGVFSFQWSGVGGGNYALTATATDNHQSTGPASNVRNIMVNGGGGTNAVTFVTTDGTTQGSWIGVYGGDGYSLEGDATSLPAYATLTPTGALTYTWSASTNDPRALQKPGGGRLAATWYNDPQFSLDVNVGNSQHQVALYCLDWDTASRSEQIDVLDAVSSSVLDTRTIAGFNGGQYLVWNVTGHVKFRVTRLAGANAVVSAVLFGGANHAPTATLTGPPDNSSFSALATVPVSATASDPDAGDTIDHVSFFANGAFIGSTSTPLAGSYNFSWPNVAAGNYSLTAQPFDNHGLGGVMSNVSHIVVGGGGGGASATFITTDATTQGTWMGVYGPDGYSLVSDVTSLPGYATISAIGADTYTWASSTSDVRALQRVGGGRVAATWYASGSFDLDVNITSGTHRVALYCLDWDNNGRAQQIDVLDAATNAVLDTRTVTSFLGGKYLVWNVSGHVKFRVTRQSGFNAVVSAVLFGG